MNIRGNHRNIRMNLEQALLQYGNDINYLVLRDGTNIEIIDDYQNENENDEFVEEKIDEDNYGYNNYIYKEIDQNGTLRGKGLKKNGNMKPLRKTILKSINNDEGKLRSTVHDNNNNNAIIKISENNEYLQCANCFKFFNEKEDEDDTDNTSNNANINSNNNININKNQIQPQNYNNVNNNNYNKNIRPQMPAQIPPRQNMYNQQYIPNQPNIPNIPKQVMPPQQKYNQNYPNNIQQQQPYYHQNQGKYPPPQNQQIPRGPQQRMNMPQPYYNNNNQIPKSNMRIPYNNQNNQIFRARKRNSGRYQQVETKTEFIQKNYVVNKYPGSAKKPRNIENDMINQEVGYTDNNLGNYFNENEIKYYDYPPIKYQTKNFFVHSSSKRVENRNNNNNYYQPEVGEFQENDYYGY